MSAHTPHIGEPAAPVELLARTGMRAGELASLEADAMVRLGDTQWLRIPVGKLHNDRYVPLLPLLPLLVDTWAVTRPPVRSGRLVERDDGQPFDRRTIGRYVAVVAKRAGVGHVHPHQLGHTLATQAINRGMSLEAIAALLGYRSMPMTLTYARVSDRTVADEYFRVTEAVEANYATAGPIAADAPGPNMRRLAADQAPRQRPPHPAHRARLPVRDHLRTLRLFRHRPAVRHDPEPSTQPRRRQRPARPRRPVHRSAQRHRRRASADRLMSVPTLIVIIGPIAAGKSTVADALGDCFRRAGRQVAVLDLDDLVETIGGFANLPPERFRLAQVVFGELVGRWIVHGFDVIAHGPFFEQSENLALLHALPEGIAPRRILLHCTLDVALERVAAKPDSVLSSFPEFLQATYQRVEGLLPAMPQIEWRFDTTTTDAQSIVDELAEELLR